MPLPEYPPKFKPEDFLDAAADAAKPPLVGIVARTSTLLNEKHFNRLTTPAYGIARLQLKAGSKKSKSVGGSEESDGEEKFFFAPGVEAAKIVVKIVNPKGKLTAAKFELYRRFDATPLWTRDLTEDEIKDGEREIDFDLSGENPPAPSVPNANFPDNILTAEHSPYKLRIVGTTESHTTGAIAWTYVHVLVHEMKLEWGPKKVLPADATPAPTPKVGSHRDLRDSLEAEPPAEGALQKLMLLSNLFKTSSAQMYDNTAYTQYQTQWGDGPQVPVFAKLTVRKSDGTGVEDPRALGGVRVLWDFEDVNENLDIHHSEPRAYVGQSVAFDVGTTKPPGDNCHKDRGGKRSANGTDSPIFPAKAGYAPKDTADDAAFPFAVEACDKRKWAALSKPWTKGEFKGKTGVVFQPSRMAGDAYKLFVYVAYELDKDRKPVIDVTDDIKEKSAVLAKTGTFEVWRKHHVPKYAKKKAFASTIDTAKVIEYYRKAHVEMEIKYASVSTMNKANYNSAIATEISGMDVFAQTALDSSVDQYDNGDHGVTFVDFNTYKTNLRAALGMTAPQFNTWLTTGGGQALNTNTKYQGFLKNWGKQLLIAACDQELPTDKDGVSLFHFIGVHNVGNQGALNGSAVDMPSGNAQRVGFLTCATPSAYGPHNKNSLEQTTTHEIGHHLFMPHAPDGVSAGAGPDPTSHDQDDHSCTMSYNFDFERRWCGFCILRLRGWDKSPLSADGSANRRP